MRDDKPFSAMFGVVRRPTSDRRRDEPASEPAATAQPGPRPMPPADAAAELEYA